MKHPIAGFISIFLIMTGSIIALPLFGAMISRNEPLSYYLEFPPRLGSVEHAPFSWIVFVGLTALILACVLPFIWRAIRTTVNGWTAEKRKGRKYPSWGYAGGAICIVAWVLAWTRFPWFSEYQPYTFPFLWIGYILIVNALTYKRTGTCLILEKPVLFLALFPASAVFWWYFEYLNRFVLNWYYSQVHMFGPWQYVIYASACFSTVLPGVLSTAELVRSFSFIKQAYRNFVTIRPSNPKALAAAVLALAAAGLFAIGPFPNALFPLLWVAPFLFIVSLQTLTGREQIFSPVKKGDWSRPVSLVAAALICGFFWEMWNFYSFARWEYSIPYVNRYQIFEMPILGYAGYLPFGLECGAVGDLLKQLTAHDTKKNSLSE